ncbi:MAG: hypothetical protein E6Q43_04380 [Dokdonella sp.]|nr:MAG: hypothetical protein E6Q43_04380 [Dokdonella sp.]
MPFVSDHRRFDQRSLALHSAVAEAIRRNPDGIRRALLNLERWEKSLQGSWISEWRALLLGPQEALLAFLTERSERADRMRQSSPFTGLLSAAERRRIYESHAA